MWIRMYYGRRYLFIYNNTLLLDYDYITPAQHFCAKIIGFFFSIHRNSDTV